MLGIRRRRVLPGGTPLTDPYPRVALGTPVSPIVVVAVDPTEVRRDVGTATATGTGFTGVFPEVHHPRTTSRLVDPIARRERGALRDVFNPI